ncbi:MAG: hypothetical protein KF773_24675 [Deltaproteobacteria bacterium]|nr:hypothetical protein [Deltaproteobacteria bacterium]
MRLPAADAVALLRCGLEHEAVSKQNLMDARRTIARGIKLARSRDHSSWWAIATAVIEGGRGQDPAEVHRRRLTLAVRLRQRSR